MMNEMNQSLIFINCKTYITLTGKMTNLSVQNVLIARKIHIYRICLSNVRENITSIAYHRWIGCYLLI